MRTNTSREKQKDIVAGSKWGTNVHRSIPTHEKKLPKEKVYSPHFLVFISWYTLLQNIFWNGAQLLHSKDMDYWAYEKAKWDKPWYKEGQTRWSNRSKNPCFFPLLVYMMGKRKYSRFRIFSQNKHTSLPSTQKSIVPKVN